MTKTKLIQLTGQNSLHSKTFKPWWYGGLIAQGRGGEYTKKNWVGVCNLLPNAYPIYDQNLQFSLPYSWPDQKFDILFMAIAAGSCSKHNLWRAFAVSSLIDNDEKVSNFF